MLPFDNIFDRSLGQIDNLISAERITAAGRIIALAGVILPLFLIGVLKFTPFEVEALKPLINNTPWLAWLYPVLGEAGASAFLGVVEILTAVLLIMSPWTARAGVIGGAIGTVTFAVTVSIMLAIPTWQAEAGGFPFLDALGQFLIKDVALLGISIAVLGDGLSRLRAPMART